MFQKFKFNDNEQNRQLPGCSNYHKSYNSIIKITSDNEATCICILKSVIALFIQKKPKEGRSIITINTGSIITLNTVCTRKR